MTPPTPGCRLFARPTNEILRRPFAALCWSMIPKSGYRFSEKIMLHQ
jgi:hypothetical protein